MKSVNFTYPLNWQLLGIYLNIIHVLKSASMCTHKSAHDSVVYESENAGNHPAGSMMIQKCPAAFEQNEVNLCADRGNPNG